MIIRRFSWLNWKTSLVLVHHMEWELSLALFRFNFHWLHIKLSLIKNFRIILLWFISVWEKLCHKDFYLPFYLLLLSILGSRAIELMILLGIKGIGYFILNDPSNSYLGKETHHSVRLIQETFSFSCKQSPLWHKIF